MSRPKKTGKSSKSTEPRENENSGKSSAPWIQIIVALIAAVAAITVAVIGSRKSATENSNVVPAASPTLSPTKTPDLTLKINQPQNREDVAAQVKRGHNSAEFKVGVMLDGEATAGDLGIFILVFDKDEWVLQWSANIPKATKGFHEITAWSGGGSADNRTKEGATVKLRAIVANITSVKNLAPNGTVRLTIDKEGNLETNSFGQAAISEEITDVRIRPIRQL